MKRGARLDIDPRLFFLVNDLLPVGIVIFSTGRGKITYVSQKVEVMLGIGADEIIGQKAVDFFPSVVDNILAAQKNGIHCYAAELEDYGGQLWIDLIPFGPNNRIQFVCGVISKTPDNMKINRQKRLKSQIDSEMSTIFDHSFDGLWICDYQGIVCRINKASARLNNLDAEFVIGKKIEDLVKEGVIDRSVTLEVIKTKEPVTFMQNLHDNKRVLVTGNPIFDESGQLSLIITNERDITELGVLRRELEKSKKLIEEYQKEFQQQNTHYTFFANNSFRSEAMQKILATVVKVAPTDTTVLIYGESGTGKNDLGKMIHSSSKRRAKPYTFIDCASLPEVLIEQELFGVESKSEQGGAEPKVGLLEMSDGGTLHINEVEKLPPNVQSKLLRFLEEGRLSRVNSQETQKLDVRIIVANSKPLLESAENRSFHKELYYRLNVIIIDIPPLRERIEDIPVLAEYYLEKFNKINEIQKKLNARVIDALCQYPFPGNLRELSNLIEQMAVLSSSKQIEVGDLPTHIQPENSFLKTEGKEKYGNLPQAVERLEKKMIVDAFKLYSNQVKVALHLNINQSTLSRKLKKYKLKGVIQG